MGVAGFFALEALAREGDSAASLEASADDDGTTRLIIAAFGAAAVLGPILPRLPGPRLPRLAGPVGFGLEAGGLVLRAWSMRTLRGSYSRTLRIEDEQPVITSGPYRLVRHPGYLGSLATWTGFALASRSVAVVGLVGGLLGRAYQRRIAAEERLLGREADSRYLVRARVGGSGGFEADPRVRE